MLETEERAILEFCLNTTITHISFCNFKAYQTSPSITGYESFLAFNFGCKITVDDELSLVVSYWEDELGDPYRAKVWNYAQFNAEALLEKKVDFEHPWEQFIGQKITGYEILDYSSSYKRHGQDGVHEVTWGVLFQVGDQQLLAAALSSEHPFRKGTQKEILVSEDTDFIADQKARFKDFVGFYGVL
ncbi:MAG TPA: hypothetical protein DCS93_02170 [Microscillaceae bacterium]|nr:hypothetical protein [Microscillaceae bacterium]